MREKDFGNNSPFCYFFVRFDKNGILKGIYTHPVNLYEKNINSILLDFEVASVEKDKVEFLVNEWIADIKKNIKKKDKHKIQRIIKFSGIYFRNLKDISDKKWE